MARTEPSMSIKTAAPCLALYSRPYCRSEFSIACSACFCKSTSSARRTTNTRSCTDLGKVSASFFISSIDRGGGIAAGAKHLALGHESGLDQVVEDDVGARARRRQIDMRRESRRRLEQAGEHRRFGEVYVARGLVEIKLCRRIDAERAAAEIGAVEIELEDLVLRQPYLKPQREKRFLDLALDGALVRQEQVLGQLLADGGAALHHAAGARVREHRAEQAGKVDAEMLVEPPVLSGERRLDQVVGELVERDCVIVADAARAQFIAIAVEEGDGELGLLQPIVVGGFTEGRDRERQQDQ